MTDADRIKELEARVAELEAAIQQTVEQLQNYADMAVDEAAATSARVAELETALRDALPHLETCFTHHVWRNEPMPEPGYLKNIRALLKEPDQ